MFDYVYQYKDHLGNVRLSYSDTDNNGVINANTEIISEKNYYPFGLTHSGYNNVISGNSNAAADKFGFGGKELQDELGLEWYDITARNYDPALGRWMNIDPLAEYFYDYTPYNYANNNPIFFKDPDGMQSTSWYANNETGAVKWVDGKDDIEGYTNLGFTVGKSDVDHNRLLMDGDTKTITYYDKASGSSTTLYDYNAQSDDSGGFINFVKELFGRESEGIRIWGNGTGSNSTRDDGNSSGATVDTNDLPSAPGGAKIRKVTSASMGKVSISNARKLAEAFNGGFKDAKKGNSIVTKGISIFSKAPIEVRSYARRGDGADPVIWITPAASQSAGSRDSTQLMNNYTPTALRRAHSYYRDSVRTGRRK
jgi:RHS repeat-associated protein